MRWLAPSVVAVALWFGGAGAAAAEDHICSAAEKAAGDAGLLQVDEAASVQTNAPWGIPKAKGETLNERLLIQTPLVEDYDDDLRVPLWATYRLDPSAFNAEDRITCFRPHPAFPAASSTTADYKEPIFDQGHLAPDGDMKLDDVAGVNSFLMTNMTPQYCFFNRGVWMQLETLTRQWAGQHPLIVTSGSVFDRDHDGARDPDDAAERMHSTNGKARIGVPSAFYKVLAYQGDDGTLHVLSILLPHDNQPWSKPEAKRHLEKSVVKIAEIEAVAGVDLHSGWNGKITEADALWAFTGPLATPLTANCKH